MPKLCRCAWDSLTIFLHEALDCKDVFHGGILVPQTFGGMANWNPHVHALITDACWDREGNCYPMPEIDKDIKGIEKLFACFVFKVLLKEGMISTELVENMNSWKHSGFRDLPGTTGLLVVIVGFPGSPWNHMFPAMLV